MPTSAQANHVHTQKKHVVRRCSQANAHHRAYPPPRTLREAQAKKKALMAERNARRQPQERGLAVGKVVAARQLPSHGSALASRVLASQVLGPSTIAHNMYDLHVVSPKGTAADKLSEETMSAMDALQVR